MAGSLLDMLYPQGGQGVGMVNAGMGLMRPPAQQGYAPGLGAFLQQQPQQRQQCAPQLAQPINPLIRPQAPQQPPNPYGPPQGSAY